MTRERPEPVRRYAEQHAADPPREQLARNDVAADLADFRGVGAMQQLAHAGHEHEREEIQVHRIEHPAEER
ncbi:hypothetical protein [Paraburkholderia caledonica]|uniref:hypothetical protein n=1 Tax=Paraburkholderia caledonica TaxID=134536 RepID=UPI001FC957F1|nr:hypothetical protein [Paraburkholderia caledonica]